MVEAQTWLENQEEYDTPEKRSKVKIITICYNDLAGSLNLHEFVALEELDCAWNKLTSLEIRNCVNLRELWCGSNQLINLDLSGLTQLEKLECCDNLLSSFDYSQLNPARLTYLNISDNDLPERDLAVFSQLINLKTLWINNHDKEKIRRGIYNRWVGSLKPLRKLLALKKLDISNTDVDSGLEYLDDSVAEVICGAKERPESAVQKIAQELTGYDNEIKHWRAVNFASISLIQENEKLRNVFLLINSALSRNIEELTKEEKLVQVLISYLENEGEEFQKQLYKNSPTISQTEIPPMFSPGNSFSLPLGNLSLSILSLLLKC